MPQGIIGTIQILSQIGGDSPSSDPNLVWHGIAAVLWGALAFVAWSKQQRLPSGKEKLLMWGFVFALVYELTFVVVVVMAASGILDPEAWRSAIPPLEHSLLNVMLILVSAGFVWYLTQQADAAKVFVKSGLAVVALCYFATFWWWASCQLHGPTTEFQQTWCGQLYQFSIALMLIVPIYLLLRSQAGWLRYLASLALLCFWMFSVFGILTFESGTRASEVFAAARRGLYFLGVALFGLVYLRALVDELAKETLQQRIWKERFEAFMDNSPFIAWVKNSKGEHQYLSQPYALQIGIPVTSWEGKTDYDLWPKEVAESHREMDQVVLNTGKPIVFESTHALPNGEVKHWYVVKFPFSVGQKFREVFVGGIGLDVTEKTIAEMERDRFFETSSELMCINDSAMCFKRVNQAFTDILGYRREELISKPFQDYVHPNDRLTMNADLDRIDAAARFTKFEVRFRCKDGSYRLIAWTTPTPDPEAKIDSQTLFAIGRDVTEQRALERRLLKIADDEQRRIAHDLHDGLGQELTGLAMMSESLALNLGDKNLPEAELAKKIAVQLEASQELTRNLARGLRPVEIDSDGLRSALSLLADRTNERYKFDCTFFCGEYVDLVDAESATQLYRIAQEAVANAARHARPNSIEIHLLKSGGQLELKIIDDGVGISSLDDSQAGIGIKSMIYRSDIIGGKLRVESIDEGGTMVACCLATH